MGKRGKLQEDILYRACLKLPPLSTYPAQSPARQLPDVDGTVGREGCQLLGVPSRWGEGAFNTCPFGLLRVLPDVQFQVMEASKQKGMKGKNEGASSKGSHPTLSRSGPCPQDGPCVRTVPSDHCILRPDEPTELFRAQ